MNYGLRYDRFDANFDNEDQVSPRANLVWKIDDKTTTFTSAIRAISFRRRCRMSTRQPFRSSTEPPTRRTISWPIRRRSSDRTTTTSASRGRSPTSGRSASMDFTNRRDNLVDLGQFGAALIETPFNYADRQSLRRGAQHHLQARWVLRIRQSLMGRDAGPTTSTRSSFRSTPMNWRSSPITTSSSTTKRNSPARPGVAYQWKNDRVYADILFGSGLRSGFANTGQVAPHYPVNVGYEHIFHPRRPTRTRHEVSRRCRERLR